MTLVVRSPHVGVWDYLGLPVRVAFGTLRPRNRKVADVWNPRFEAVEQEGQLKLSVELPGVEAEDIEVTTGGDVVTVKCTRKYDRAVERNGYHWQEHSERLYARSVPMPKGADTDRVAAQFENGVLEVTVPIVEAEAEETARIEVRSAGYKDETETRPTEEGTDRSEGGEQAAAEPEPVSQTGSGEDLPD